MSPRIMSLILAASVVVASEVYVAAMRSIDYPQAALHAQIEGIAIVDVELRQDGTVSDVIGKAGHPILQRAVLSAIRKWRFSEACGTASSTRRHRLEVKFELVDDAERQPVRSFVLVDSGHAHVKARTPGWQPKSGM